ncbi:MAG: recombinase family protein [Chloroflexi bacterium]|nr:recombinase family protein [Chloroflexota bacterium]
MTISTSTEILTTTAAVYCRVSTDRQAEEGVSLDVQRLACLDYAEAQGWAIQEVYIDDESSYAPRAEYTRMLTAAVAEEFNALLVYDFSRFGRDIAQSPADVARLELLGIKVISVTSPHAGRLERNIQFVMSDWYSYELGKQVKPSHILRVQQGLWVSRPPVGYNLEPAAEGKLGRKTPKKLALDGEMAPKVVRLFQLCASGTYSVNALVREADIMGLKSHTGRNIARSNIAHIFRNPVYIGKVVYGRYAQSKFEKKGARPESEWVVAEGQHPPLIDEETFRKCGEILSRRQKAYGSLTGGMPLLTGVVYCDFCGSKMVGKGRWRQRQGQGRSYYVIYRCYRAEHYRDCANKSYHGGRGLEQWAKEQLMQLPITPEDRAAAKREAERILRGQTGDVKAKQKLLQDQRDAHVEELKALSWRLVREEIPASIYAEMRQDKEVQLIALDSQLKQLVSQDKQDTQSEEVLNLLGSIDWADFDDQAWKETLALLVKRIIVVGRGQYRIEWQPGVEVFLPK